MDAKYEFLAQKYRFLVQDLDDLDAKSLYLTTTYMQYSALHCTALNLIVNMVLYL